MLYDLCIIGAGPGCFGVLEALKEKNYSGLILIIEDGYEIENRTKYDRMHGFGGAGAFTDMKLMIDDETGGDISKYAEDPWYWIYKSRNFYIRNGAPNNGISPDYQKEIIQCNKYNFRLVNTKEIIHCGTDKALQICKNINGSFDNLHICWLFNSQVDKILLDNEIYKLSCTDGDIYSSKKVVVATGRSNTLDLSNLDVKYDNNVVDIGVRCDIDVNSPMKPWFDKFYHPKIEYLTPTYQDRVRTFCSNPEGFISIEDYGDFKLINGDGYKEIKSLRTNFAILVSIPFTEPFKNGNEFARKIARTVCQLNDGKPIVQAYRDLKHGRRSTLEKIKIPICTDTNPGDLSIVIPYRYLKDIIEFIDNLDKMFTGIVDNMLLYGLEAKFYANRPKFIDNYFQVKPNLYFVGDCSGVTRGIIQATAMGLVVGEKL